MSASIFLTKNHLVLRDPNGSDGNVRAMRDAGYGVILCNVRDFPASSWTTIRERAREAGVACGPWARTSNGGFWDETMLQTLVKIADAWQSPLVVDSEKELDGSGDTLTKHIATVLGDRDYAMSVEAWPFSSVDWTPLAHVPFCPQIFPAESEPAKDPNGCRAQWRKVGISCVVFTFGCYAGMKPSQFDRLSPYGAYTGDDMGGQYQAWKPLGTHEPCAAAPAPVPPSPEVPPTMPPVTDQQARDSIGFSVQAAAQNWGTDTKPRARLTVCRRITQAGNDDAKWNACSDVIVKALDDAGIPH
jgi:hypothetical protein